MSENKSLIFTIGAIALVVVLLFVFGRSTPESDESVSMTTTEESQASSTPTPVPNAKSYQTSPGMVLKSGADYKAVMKTTKGDITIDLFESENPVTVNNFVFLSNEGFYNNTRFHRIIKGFMIQGGDPLGNGTGGPGYKFSDEPITRDYKKGIIAMANSGPNTNGSQFFIMHNDYPLPKNYVIFGQVTEGLDVVDRIAETPVKENVMGERSSPLENVLISSIEIVEN